MKIREIVICLSGLFLLHNTVFAKAPDYTFIVDSVESSVNISITVTGMESTDQTNLSGWIQADANPNFSPFGNIHVTDLDIEATRDMDFVWPGDILFSGQATVSDYGMSMVEPGPETTASNGSFSQPDNLMQSRGIIDYSFTVFFVPYVGTMDMATESEPALQTLTGKISQIGGNVKLELDIYHEEIMVVDMVGDVPVVVTGKVVAYAPAKWVDEDIDNSLTVDTNDLRIMAYEWLCRDLASDFNGDGFVDLLDYPYLVDFSGFIPFVHDWLQPSQELLADVNKDNVTNLLDLAALGSYWLQSAPW